MLGRVRGRVCDRSPADDLGGPSPLSHRPGYVGVTQRDRGSGDIYVTVKGVKRSGKVSRATIGRRLPWFRHPPINAPKQLSPNPDRTDLLRALHYLHKCNRRARVYCREYERAGEEMPLTCRGDYPSRGYWGIEGVTEGSFDFIVERVALDF